MKSFDKIMNSWEQVLNNDKELAERNLSPYSTMEGRTAVQLEVKKMPAYIVNVHGSQFTVTPGQSTSVLLCWKMPCEVFKDVMLGRHRLLFCMLDPRGKLIFDTPNFSHWNGATVIEMLLLAHEMAVKRPEISNLVEKLEC